MPTRLQFIALFVVFAIVQVTVAVCLPLFAQEAPITQAESVKPATQQKATPQAKTPPAAALNVTPQTRPTTLQAPPQPAKKVAAPKTNIPPLKLSIDPKKRIYSSREGVMIQFMLTAINPSSTLAKSDNAGKVKVCLENDVLNQFDITLSRSGQQIPLKPLVTEDNRELTQKRMTIRWLTPGEKLLLRANLKRFHFADTTQWTPSEYNVTGRFRLCEQTPGDLVKPNYQEIPIEADNTGWFMIMS